jgi:hypothetical protein
MKIGLVVCGMILGVLASFIVRPVSVQAQNRTDPVRVDLAGIGMTTNIGTREVVGFSCIPREGGAMNCFLASR